MSKTSDQPEATLPADRVLFKPDLSRRYNKARETIWRWERDGKLPPHDVVVAGHKGWRLATIVAFESASAA